jgi:hypothetical protein
MKLSLAFVLSAVAACSGCTLGSIPAYAAEGPRDVETDHVDAYDDAGKPTVGVLANPGALVLGALAAEVDLALGDAAALSVEVAGFGVGVPRAYGGALGVPLFVERVRFHGLYVEPRLAARVTTSSPSAVAAGLGATAGWQETWRFGLSLKGGLGLLYEMPVGGDGLVVGIRPLVDAAVGWLF